MGGREEVALEAKGTEAVASPGPLVQARQVRAWALVPTFWSLNAGCPGQGASSLWASGSWSVNWGWPVVRAVSRLQGAGPSDRRCLYF